MQDIAARKQLAVDFLVEEGWTPRDWTPNEHTFEAFARYMLLHPDLTEVSARFTAFCHEHH